MRVRGCIVVHTRIYVHRPYTCKLRQDTKSPIECMDLKPTMLASSVHTVVACNATALRVCTLVLFIQKELDTLSHSNNKYAHSMA